ncbi:hypothetical protein FRC03_012495 [Tulasnella sp. 419]|nr:hypothetical protein FRC03_012495 [Tulasnella sp. 419]
MFIDFSPASLDGFLIFVSCSGLVGVCSIIVVDILRRGAVSSKVWFELIWLSLFWVMHLAGASASTALLPALSCPAKDQNLCVSAQALTVFTWLSMGLLLTQLLLLLLSSIYYSKRHPEVWVTPVRDFQWFCGGGAGTLSLGSRPSSPEDTKALAIKQGLPSQQRPGDLEKGSSVMVTHFIQPNVVVAPVPQRPGQSSQATTEEPRPLTLDYAPQLPPARAPVHYTASSATTLGGLPRRKSKENSLYPAHMQAVAKSTTSLNTNTNLPSRQLTGNTAAEPLPIRNWPRQNPQEPLRREKQQRPQQQEAPVVPSTLADTTTKSSPPRAAPASRPTGPRSAKRRPPPLDFSNLHTSKR